MATWIKTGFWEKTQIGFKGWLNLDQLIQSIGGGAAAIQFQENGSDLGNNQATTVDIKGAGVTGTRVGNKVIYSVTGSLDTIVGGDNISVDNTDPSNPIINLDATDPLLSERDLDIAIPVQGAVTTNTRQILEDVQNNEAGDYVVFSGDAYKTTYLSKGSAGTITFSPNSSDPIPVGTVYSFRRIGAGEYSLIAGVGVTINTSLGSLTDPGLDAEFKATKTAIDEWYIDNGLPNNAVPVTRTIAGIDLVDNITSSELAIALAVITSRLIVGVSKNRFHGSSLLTGAASLSTTSFATGSLKASPFIVAKNMTIDTIQAEVTTFGASGKLRLGIYADNGSCYPGSLVVGSSEIDAGSNGVKSTSISASLTPGLYWLACLGGTATGTYRAESSTCFFPNILGYDSAMGATIRQPYWVVAQAYGALPNPFTASGTINNTSTNIPIILVRASV